MTHPVVVEFFRDRKGEYRWRLRSRNGQVVAVSGEGYTRKGNEIRAWNAMVRLMVVGQVTRRRV